MMLHRIAVPVSSLISQGLSYLPVETCAAKMQSFSFRLQSVASAGCSMASRLVRVIRTISPGSLLTRCQRACFHSLGLVRYPSQKRCDYIEGLISKAPALKESYALRTGTWEQYTVYEHTQLVIERAYAYEKEIKSSFGSDFCLSFDEFVLFLALHDIGKGESRLSCNQHLGKTLKERENICTIKTIRQVAQSVNLSDPVCGIFCALLKYDSIGEYLKGAVDLQTCRAQFQEAADEAGIGFDSFKTIIDLYHRCDAGAYKRVAACIFDKSGFERIQSHQKLMEAIQLLASEGP